MSYLSQADPEIARVIELEKRRQRESINLVASENYASPAVLEAQGSFLTCKYAEGYPHKRYYGGCENIDAIETIAIDRAKELFHAEYANVQPHSGAQANMASYFSQIACGDTVLAMSLAHGGHLTHGDHVNFSGHLYNFVHYHVNKETERIDYAEVEQLAIQHKPKIIVAGASSYPRVIDFERFRKIADMVGAKFMVDMAHIAGLVAAGVHPSPVPYADIVTSTTHKTLRGPRAGFILAKQALGPALDSAVFPQTQGGPLVHAIMARAICFHEAMQPSFVAYQKAVLENAQVLAKELSREGLRLVSGGTDNHLMLVDLTKTGVSGKEAQESLESAGIVANRNAIPFDTRSPRIASGIRLGTPAATTRGLGKAEMKQIADWIVAIIADKDNLELRAKVKEGVCEMCAKFPIPGVD